MLVGRTLVDTSNWYAEVLVINVGSDVVVLSPFSCVGDVVQVSAVTVARTLSTQLLPRAGRALGRTKVCQGYDRKGTN